MRILSCARRHIPGKGLADMFTGIIQSLGEIVGRESPGGFSGEVRFRIRVLGSMAALAPGESIAVNGVCLTLETHANDDSWFTAYASAETLRVSTLAELQSGSRVNLERALALGDRLGGHLVSGHVDGVGKVAAITPAGNSREVRIAFPADLGTGVIAKGSVALDGVSLTINRCGLDFLIVNIIPETWNNTTLNAKKAGDRINIETDMIGKYVVRWLQSRQEQAGEKSGLSMEFLKEHGF